MVTAVNSRGSRDWIKAIRTYQSDKEQWLSDFQKAYEKKSLQWSDNYQNFLHNKSVWVEDLAVKTSLAGSEFVIGDVSKSAKDAITEATKDSLVKWEDENSKLSEDGDYLTNLVTADFNKMIDTVKAGNSTIANANISTNGLLDISALKDVNIMQLVVDLSTEDKETLEKELLYITALKAEENIQLAKDS